MGNKILLHNKKQLLEYLYKLIENDFNCKIEYVANRFCLNFDSQRYYVIVNG